MCTGVWVTGMCVILCMSVVFSVAIEMFYKVDYNIILFNVLKNQPRRRSSASAIVKGRADFERNQSSRIYSLTSPHVECRKCEVFKTQQFA